MQFKTWLETNSLSPQVKELVKKFKSWDSSQPYPGFNSSQIYDFIAVLSGSKPAALASLGQLKNDPFYPEFNNILKLIGEKQGYIVKNFNHYIKHNKINSIVAGLSNNVNAIINAYQDKDEANIDHKAIGLALGYSAEQVNQFLNKS